MAGLLMYRAFEVAREAAFLLAGSLRYRAFELAQAAAFITSLFLPYCVRGASFLGAGFVLYSAHEAVLISNTAYFWPFYF